MQTQKHSSISGGASPLNGLSKPQPKTAASDPSGESPGSCRSGQASHAAAGGTPTNTPSNVANDAGNHGQPFVLTGDLRRILVEVSRTGVCSWLPWDRPDAVVMGGGRVPVAQSAPSASSVKGHRTTGISSTAGAGGSTCNSEAAAPTTALTHSSTLPASGINSLSASASPDGPSPKLSMAVLPSSSSPVASTAPGNRHHHQGTNSNEGTPDRPSSTGSADDDDDDDHQSHQQHHRIHSHSHQSTGLSSSEAGSPKAHPQSPSCQTLSLSASGPSSTSLASAATEVATNVSSTQLHLATCSTAVNAPESSPVASSLSSNAESAHYQQPFSTHRRSGLAVVPKSVSRKKHRKNGRHGPPTGYRQSGASNSANRKRPLFLIRTMGSSGLGTSAVGSTSGACGSVGSSGRASGSEMDDSTLYECDSEGTTATTNSEMSFDRNRSDLSVIGKHIRGGHSKTALASLKTGYTAEDTTRLEEESTPPIQYKTMQEAVRVAIGLVLDHYYRRKGGYKLSPAEKRRNAALEANAENKEGSEPTKNGAARDSSSSSRTPLSAEAIFQQRRERLLLMLISSESDNDVWVGKPRGQRTRAPPFTIQRIAEVLLNPEKYYTQTHKLCNCLEKLLLVTSSTRDFGGSTGGDTSQSRREERELAALASEKGRILSELKQRRVKRRIPSPLDGPVMNNHVGMPRSLGRGNDVPSSDPELEIPNKKMRRSPSPDGQQERRPDDSSQTREMIVAAARASLRSKFDHVGIDPHSSASANRDVRSITDNRGMTKSPPPPGIGMQPTNNVGLGGHSDVTGFGRQQQQQHNDQSGDHSSIGRLHTPMLLSPKTVGSHDIRGSSPHSVQVLHHNHHPPNLSRASEGSEQLGVSSPNHSLSSVTKGAANESGMNDSDPDLGRSSASNSDVDSESDDVSLDDSASDRSDGSDSGSLVHYEPFSPARAMALNRMQQQQRLQNRTFMSLSSLHPNDPSYRPPADSEYQSGDSIDSTRAEDSGGSDSSSSDVND